MLALLLHSQNLYASHLLLILIHILIADLAYQIRNQYVFLYNILHIMSNPKQNKRILQTKNPWHFVSPGQNAPQVVRALIEIPTGSKAKYELDKETGLIKLDRILFSAVHYPANYGFIPMTYGGDHDPLDILVICSVDLEIMSLVDAKVIGVMRMIDQGELDDKIIAVANNDQSVNHYNNIEQLPKHVIQQIHRFFEDYKKLEEKEVSVQEFAGREKAYEIINEAIEFYRTTFTDISEIEAEAARTTKEKEKKEEEKANKSLTKIEIVDGIRKISSSEKSLS